METLMTNQDDSSEANPSSVKSDDGASPLEEHRKSPPPNCAICLGKCRNKSFTDSCLHQFCFKCLVTWSKVKTECPLCKQIFKSIIHNVRSNHQYEEYPVEPPPATEQIEIRDLFSRRYRFRATLTMPRHESLAFQQFLMQYPLLRGGAGAAGAASAAVAGTEPRATRSRLPPTSFRSTVYRHNLWARPLPDFTGRFRDCTPEFYRCNSSQIHRLVPWLSRELHYLLNENSSHIAYVLSRILELLPQHHITSIEFRDAMRSYFGERTEHFLHELYCFAATPYDLTGYDRYVQYSTDSRISSMVQELASGSESDSSRDSDIQMVSSSHPAEPRAAAGPSRAPAAPAPAAAAPAYPRSYIPQPDASDRVIPIETISHSDTDDDSSEVMVVGYIKPPGQRTPEVVDLLGSDSDVVLHEPAPAPEPAAAPAPATAPAPTAARDERAVKLTLSTMKRPQPEESDSDAAYSPPPPPARRRRRPRAAASRDYSPSSTGPDLSDRSSDSTDSTSSSDERTTSKSKKGKGKRKISRRPAKRSKGKMKKRSPSRQRRRSDDRTRERSKDKGSKSSKRKSRNGKDVKSSKKVDSPEAGPSEPAPPAADEPGPSNVNGSRKRKSGDENGPCDKKRLKSVVKVMNRHGRNDESRENEVKACGVKTRRMRNSSTGTSRHTSTENNVRTQYTSTDTEDDVPLNLTLHKL